MKTLFIFKRLPPQKYPSIKIFISAQRFLSAAYSPPPIRSIPTENRASRARLRSVSGRFLLKKRNNCHQFILAADSSFSPRPPPCSALSALATLTPRRRRIQCGSLSDGKFLYPVAGSFSKSADLERGAPLFM